MGTKIMLLNFFREIIYRIALNVNFRQNATVNISKHRMYFKQGG